MDPSHRGGVGAPTPLSSLVERDWATSDFLTAYLERREADLPEHLETTHRGLVRSLRRYLDRQLPELEVPSAEVTGAPPAFACLSGPQRNLELAAAVTSYNPEIVEALLAPLEPSPELRPEVLVARSRAALAAGDLSASARWGEQALSAGELPPRVHCTSPLSDLVRDAG